MLCTFHFLLVFKGKPQRVPEAERFYQAVVPTFVLVWDCWISNSRRKLSSQLDYKTQRFCGESFSFWRIFANRKSEMAVLKLTWNESCCLGTWFCLKQEVSLIGKAFPSLFIVTWPGTYHVQIVNEWLIWSNTFVSH